jgi:tripartite-type tricarboxylate transporter receptor subunit TctC
MRVRRQQHRYAAMLAATALLAAACGENGGDDGAGGDDGEAAANFPEREINWIVPTPAGGGFDRTTRTLQPYVEEELGQPLEVLYREGGNYAIGAASLLREGADCHNVMIHGTPLLQFSHLTQEVGFTWEDFYPAINLTIDPSVIRVGNDTPWETFDELIEDALDRPGEIRLGLPGRTDVGYFGVQEIMEATGAEFNLIFYDGGGPTRTALAGGEIDVTHTGAYNSLGVADESRVLAIHQSENEWADITDEAPTVSEVIGEDVDDNAVRYQIWTTAECRDENPEHFEILQDALLAATQSEDYLAELEEVGEEGNLDVIEGEEYHDEILVPESQMYEEEAEHLDDDE